MRRIVLIGAMALLAGSAHAQATKDTETAPATPAVAEPAPAPAAVTPAAAPAATAPAAAPAAAEAPASPAQPAVAAAPAPRPAKKRQQARRHESDEHKARRIAAKYGISW